MRLTCPKCDASLRLAEAPDEDTPVLCPECNKTFYYRDQEDEDAEPRRAKKGGKKRRRDDEDDEPQKKFPVVPVVAGSIAVVAVLAVGIGVFIASRPKSDPKPADTAAAKPEEAKVVNPRIVDPVVNDKAGGPGGPLAQVPPGVFTPTPGVGVPQTRPPGSGVLQPKNAPTALDARSFGPYAELFRTKVDS